jgi:hypothetical protein
MLIGNLQLEPLQNCSLKQQFEMNLVRQKNAIGHVLAAETSNYHL